jgi:hypothetical protein
MMAVFMAREDSHNAPPTERGSWGAVRSWRALTPGEILGGHEELGACR